MVALIQNDPITQQHYGHYRLGMMVALAGMVMLFTSLTSAYIVRAAASNDWVTLPVPRMLWVSTALILISSATLEMARKALRHEAGAAYGSWLAVTSVLGLGFLVAQLVVWRELARQGLYISSNPHSSFFYLLTGTHGLHLAGGLLALIYLFVRFPNLRQGDRAVGRQIAAADAATLYWHFMDALWIFLFLLLFLWK
ncbi:MAG TPA: cytochrome c oxidase subunit 3 [Pyrinomonadaceae bacterium]|nr:cytochrome c oxidase subunit 3 [Pyrinomonadaceae bacterium]